MSELNTRIKELRRLTQELESAVKCNFYGSRVLNELVAAEMHMACVGVLMREKIDEERKRLAA